MYQQCIWSGRSTLGESPIWDPQSESLYWIDMGAPVLNCLDIKTGNSFHYKTPSPLGSINLSKNGDILTTTGQDIGILRKPDFEFEQIHSLGIDDTNIVFNDGKCDAYGRFWVGTRDLLLERSLSMLYLFETKRFQPKVENLIVSNGLGWSPDNKRFYLTDTIKKTIYRYPFDIDNATLGEVEVFITVSEEGIYPDGLAIDSEENIWVAMWGAGKIVCYKKDGSILSSIELPAKNVTSCCFGGKDLKTLFVTSATFDFGDNNDLGKDAGGLFAISSPVPGLKPNYYQQLI